jgi:DNA ligase (NAD+)
LGIRYVGETTARMLAQSVSHLLDLSDMSTEELQRIEDVGVKVAESIRQFFSNPDNIRMLKRLEETGVELKSRKATDTQGSLTGKTFLFTGTLRMKRSDAEGLVEANGGKLLSGVSSKLDYLVVGDDAGSKLEKARKISSIHILDEDAFLKMVGQPL